MVEQNKYLKTTNQSFVNHLVGKIIGINANLENTKNLQVLLKEYEQWDQHTMRTIHISLYKKAAQ